MDEYPTGSLDHNVPLLVVSGLTNIPPKPLLTDPAFKEESVAIRSELSPVDGREAKAILHHIQASDATDLPWNTGDAERKHRFKVRAVGREFLLPPRRAPLPEDVEAPESPYVLHSPFSPLSPGSSLYPDGLVDTRWIKKHQDLIPSVYLAFYTLTADPNLATLHDNQLKTDINALKASISKSGYKCRLAVVILSDQAPESMSPFQERLENIRWGTGLDPKTSLFVLPTQRPDAELESAVDSILSALFVQATEYYRDLSRRSRKKKGRGVAPQPTVPPTTGTSHTLSLQGWSVRYDFKAGIFAEFRQEMDVAVRSYEQAYETLLGPEVLVTIPSWSPKFNDGRLLADLLAIRTIRCLLWTGQSTAAVRRWQAHRIRTSDFLDRNASGTQNYGWFAWEARWAEVMAGLVEKVGYPELEPSSHAVFRLPEKTLSAERLQPWEMLHHPGYWYRIAARHTLDRRKLAYRIPEDDRKAPDVSPSAKKSYISYDTYMSPEPHEEYPLQGQGTAHGQKILNYLNLARTEFQKRQQTRFAVEVALDAASELEKLQAWTQILELLAPSWRDMSFRTEEWWECTESLSWILRRAAAEVGQADLVVAIDWELLNKSFSKRSNWHYDITRSLDNIKLDQRPEINIGSDRVSSFLTSTFVFKHDEGRAGQTCPAQLVIKSDAFPGSPPVVLDEINVKFEGSARTLSLKHEKSTNDTPKTSQVVVTHTILTETESRHKIDGEEDFDSSSPPPQSVILQGKDDLTLSPGQIRVFQIDLPLREAGEAHASVVEVTVAPEAFRLAYSMKLGEGNSAGFWYTVTGRKKATRVNPHMIKVLPRPPKMEIKFTNALNQYYAGEPIQIEVELINNEDVDANTKLDIFLYGQEVPAFKARVENGSEQASVGEGEEIRLSNLSAGTIPTAKSSKATIIFDPISRPTAYDLTIKANYNLVSDPATPIAQIVAFQINVVNPFEASYDLVPRLHNETWPSIFDPEAIQELENEDEASHHALGLAQKWCLVTRFASFATEDLRILDLEVRVLGTQGGARCTASKCVPLPIEGISMSPRIMEEARFDLIAQKLSLDDRSPSTADLAFIIKWQRTSFEPAGGSTVSNTTSFLLDPFYVTVSEPRVIAAVSYSRASPSSPPLSPSASTGAVVATKTPSLVILDVTIENPSSHFLTFGLTMEPSSDGTFAFSGAKNTTLNVLPLSRRTVTYRLLPLVEGGTWIKPTLIVRDKYFQKILKIIPTEGMKRDTDGLGIWIPEDVAMETEGGR
ncbi:Gryzun, putative trafficking through golgi-domain-containing protein [Xylariales sp. PMI_506]|nr:Gryzun, putative trafficking through golgi-domain-containing protein [Xylariales sp. PMI_506]